ncbi:DNA double-strand break repair nuclease NurA [Haloarcula sp. Atlit-47R]|uniref:DNA double-strand break repair nuclease NurA n=1 Tax=Haloarcula sp. Atlit-47R TaxID=2282132 RepID=UPI001314CB0C|nr:DNA double-strand break repair nuclease NurA [Haloarcula sp. Atlit-47R]
MPYSTRSGGFERASGTGHSKIIESQTVREKLNEFEIRQPDPDEVPVASHSVARDEIESNAARQPIDTVVSVDGSPQEVAVDQEFPEDRIAYLQLSAVRVELDTLAAEDSKQFVNPGLVEESTDSARYVVVLPSSNVTSESHGSTAESWRSEIDEVFRTHEIEGRSLLSYFVDVLHRSDRLTETGEFVLNQCPDCGAGDQALDPSETGTCTECGETLYLTDSLRIYEKVNGQQSNIGALMQLMAVMEHLILIGYLLHLHEHDPDQLGRTAFIHDGPLAIHQQPSWLHRPLKEVLMQVFDQRMEAGLDIPPVIGVEKNSKFVDHASRIGSRIERESLLYMDDDYIYDYVIPSRQSASGYGSRTYYGQRFIYRSSNGGLYVVTVPKIPGEDAAPHLPEAYPWLDRVLSTIEQAQTSLYENALLPVVIAHQLAAMPAEMGSSVLRLFSQSELDR